MTIKVVPKMSGHGSDENGDFTISSNHNSSKNQFIFYQNYANSQRLFIAQFVDNKISGSWNCGTEIGTFELLPGKIRFNNTD